MTGVKVNRNTEERRRVRTKQEFVQCATIASLTPPQGLVLNAYAFSGCKIGLGISVEVRRVRVRVRVSGTHV